MKLFMRNACTTRSIGLWGMGILLMELLPLMVLGERPTQNASVAATKRTCKHATNMWGDPNPNIFYVCNNVADQEQLGRPVQLQCPQGRGFFNGHGHLGCLPFDQWPACRLTASKQTPTPTTSSCDSSTNGSDSQAKTILEPWAAWDPNQFYMCPGVNATPLLLNCAPGKGFIQTSQTVGCADWPQWRRQMQCEAYF